MSDVLPDALRELLGRKAFGLADHMCVVFQGDFGIAVTHHPRNDVDWSAGLKQLSRYTVAKAVNSNVSSLRFPSDNVVKYGIHQLDVDSVQVRLEGTAGSARRCD